jgi:hypothetical protein
MSREVLALQQGAEPRRVMRYDSAETSSLTLGEAMDLYFAHGKERRVYDDRIRARLGAMQVKRFKTELLDHFAPLLFPGLAASTIDREFYGRIAAVIHHAAKKKRCEHVPIRRLGLSQNGEVHWLSPADSVRFEQACAPHFRPLYILMQHTPLDPADAVYLKWNQVSRDCCEIHLPHREDSENAEEGECRLRLHSRAASALRALPRGNGSVFLTPEGVPYKRTKRPASAFKSALAGAAQDAGLELTYRTIQSTYCAWRVAVDREAYLPWEFGRSDERGFKKYKRIAPADLDVLCAALHDQGWDREFARSPIVLP